MEEIVWIRPADFDPTVLPGSIIRPDADLPTFRVLGRQQVVMMFRSRGRWEVRPFTQLTLVITATHGSIPENGGEAGVLFRGRKAAIGSR